MCAVMSFKVLFGINQSVVCCCALAYEESVVHTCWQSFAIYAVTQCAYMMQGKYLSNSLSVWLSVPFCILCMYKLYMYVCIFVGTSVLTCSIIVLYSL